MIPTAAPEIDPLDSCSTLPDFQVRLGSVEGSVSRRIRVCQVLFNEDAAVADGLQALPWLLAQAALEQIPKPDPCLGREPFPVGFLLDHGSERVGYVLPRERAPTGEHFVEHDAEGPDVGTAIHRFAARLLRRHVGRGAENDAGLRSRDAHGRRVGRISRSRRFLDRLCQAEVQHLHPGCY